MQAKQRKMTVIRKSMKIAVPAELGSRLIIRMENFPVLGTGSKDLR